VKIVFRVIRQDDKSLSVHRYFRIMHLHLSISISATPERVWEAVTTDAPYREWTAAFNPTSFFDGGWQTGDKIRFIGTDEEGAVHGMTSEIAEARYPEFISIKHLGLIVSGVEDTTSDAVRSWAPAFENYTITANDDGTTTFALDMDTNEEFYDMFVDIWPKALAILKDVCERD
jgi:Activator of Hsp90 ATPase homolog 1-like protein